MDEQQQPSSWLQRLKNFIYQCRIVLRVTKKPTREEFKTIVKVSGLGIIIIGLIGFVVQIIRQVFFKL